MPSSVSFLQAASAKTGSVLPASSSSLQLLLVEDEDKSLSYSLAMDAAYSLVSSSSSVQCRGCGFSEHNACRCCRVAMLVTRRKESTTANNERQQQHKRKKRNESDIPFPLWCYKEGDDSNKGEIDQSALNQIQIKYVNSIEDCIRYLLYAPSLPKHLIPLDGIIVMGLGDLISREHSAGSMELTNAMSILSDTGCVLDKMRREIAGSSDSGMTSSTTVVATINQQIYSSLPHAVYKQLGFSVASVQMNDSKLVFEDPLSRNSFSFTAKDEEIIWSV